MSQVLTIPAEIVEKGDVLVVPKCFLCDNLIENVTESFDLFEKRFRETGEEDCPLSTVIGSALARELSEESVHSKDLCMNCNDVMNDYEAIEQRYFQLKYKIIEEFNRTAKIYGVDLVEFEISAVDEITEFVQMKNETIIEEGDDDTTTMPNNQPEIINFLVTKNMIETSFEVPIDTFEDKINDDGENSGDDECSDHMVEIMSEDVHYEQIIEHHSTLSNDLTILDTTTELTEDATDKSIFNDCEMEKEEDEVVTNTKLKKEKTQLITTDNSRPSFQFDGEKFMCLCCSDEDANHEYDSKGIGLHLKSAHNIRLFACDICGKGYGRRNELTDHIDSEHGNFEDGEYQCETCLRIFTSSRLFKIHKRMHYNVVKTFECTVCNKKYTSKNLLDEHMNMHTGDRPFKCSECQKDFASKYTLNAHMKIHLNRPRPFACKDCMKSFFSLQNLHQHQKTHTGVKDFSCNLCHKAFGTQHNLDVHKVVHTGYKPFICRTCGKAFARRAEIKDHERTHTGEKPFSCDVCGLSFAQRSNLTTHKRATHLNDKRYKCTVCERSFKRRRLLDYHIRASHTGERPYKCGMCTSSFVYPEHYKKHLKLHTGVKPYSCEVCGKTFNSRDNRNAHRFVHSDKKPYECLVCGMGFMRKPLLYSHMQAMGHINDTIVVNQPRIKDNSDDKSNDGDDMDNIFINSGDIMVDEEESNEIILEEEHLIDHMTEFDNDSENCITEIGGNYDNNDSSSAMATEILNDEITVIEAEVESDIADGVIKTETDSVYQYGKH